MKKVALLGCGAINTIVAEQITKQGFAEIVGAYDIFPKAIDKLKEKTGNLNIKSANSIEELLELKPDVVIEAASPYAAAKYDPIILKQASIVSLDTGILSKQYSQLKAIAKESGNRIYFPSGAIAGLDAVLAMKNEGITKLEITTTKKPTSLQGYEHITKRTEIFYGTASEAIEKFPKNINVAVTLSYSAFDGEKDAMVRIIADPEIEYNQHKIKVQSAHSKVTIEVDNIPSKYNPKTSYLAALSAVSSLKKALDYNMEVVIGG
jgi:aspartate dehydrogenase